jgi:hypothetical protein
MVDSDSESMASVKGPDLMLVLLRKTIQCTTSSIAPGYTDTGMYKMAGSWQTL